MVMVAPGCSGPGDDLPREAVWGTVTVDGKPLASGAIRFTPVEGGTTSGGSPITDGKYSISREQGLVPGSYKVAVNSASTKTESTKPAEPGRPVRSERPKETLPMKYNAKSILSAEVKKGGSNSFTFELQSE